MVKSSLYSRSRWAKLSLYISGLIVVLITTLYTNYLSQRLAENERNNAFLFGMAMSNIQDLEDPNIELEQQIIISSYNKRVQIILEDEIGTLEGFNFGDKRNTDTEFLLKERDKLLRSGFEPIEGEGYARYIYYKNSFLLTLIKWFPLVQILLIVIFVLLGYLTLNSARKAEQNRVWVGMAKETAHQLGTPISAILGWIEYLKTMVGQHPASAEIVDELVNDIAKLELIADRFSKIGSAPRLEKTGIWKELEAAVRYMEKRSSRNVRFIMPEKGQDMEANINPHLFSWVIENLFRNALDALDGKGEIRLSLEQDRHHVLIDVTDTGKGIPSGKFKKVFQPGYTTKKRGWGLGLSLAKRIIEEYHKGRIFVKRSEPSEGTTFRIILPRA